MSCVLLDLDGVLYDGADKPIAGAVETVAWLEKQGIAHVFLTNTTSQPRSLLVQRLQEMGMSAKLEQLLSPAVAAARWLEQNTKGPVALFVPEPTREDFSSLPLLDEGLEEGATAVVVGDMGHEWNFHRLNRAFRLLHADRDCALLALGMTRYWRAPDGLRLDVAPWVVALEHATGRRPVVMGKPADVFFAAALDAMDQPPQGAVMIGDDIVSDIAGAQQAGLEAVLVRTGKFQPEDLQRGVEPNAVLDSVADLPGWWQQRHG